MRLTSWLLMATACISLSAQAEVYKWVDSSGRVVYSDQPPPAGVAKPSKVNVKDTAVTSVAGAKKADAASAPNNAAEANKANPPTAGNKPPRDEAACAAAQKRLTFLQSAKLFKEVNEKGSIEFLEAEKKKQEIAEKQSYLDKNCK